MAAFLLKYCPPLRKIVIVHFFSKFMQSLFYVSVFTSICLMFLPVTGLLGERELYARTLLIPLFSLLLTSFEGSFIQLLVLVVASAVFLPSDEENYAICLTALIVFLKLLSPHAQRVNFVDYHFSSRPSIIVAALEKTFWRAISALICHYLLKCWLESLEVVFDYALLFVVSAEFTKNVYFALLYEPMQRIQGDPARLAVITANIACYLECRADNNLRHYESEREYEILVKENKKQGKKTPPKEDQTRIIPTSHMDTFVINQVICAVQNAIATSDTLINSQELLEPAVELAEKMRSGLKPESNQPLMNIFEAPGAFMSCLMFYYNFLQMCAQDALSRSFSSKNERIPIRMAQNNSRMQEIFTGETAIELNEIAMVEQEDNDLEFDDEDNYDFGFDVEVDENELLEAVQKQQFQIDENGRMRVKLSKFEFMKLFFFSPLTFDELVNDSEAVQEYLEEKAKEQLFARQAKQGRAMDTLTLKFLRDDFELRQSKTEDLIVLRSVVSAVNEVGFGLRGSEYYYLCKDATMSLLKLIYQSLNQEGKDGEAVRCECKVESCLSKE